jgi:hypothetical protein
LNIINQNTIDKEGNIIPKDRLTHDQSFIFQSSNSSVNSRLDKANLTPCTFGWTIKRLVNWTVAARWKHPNRKILASKINFKSAYRCCHLHHTSAVQSCAILPSDNIALLALRLTFGGAACAFEWSEISETICDLATAITNNVHWDPKTLFSPLQDSIPPPIFLPDDVSFEEGKDLAVDLKNQQSRHSRHVHR